PDAAGHAAGRPGLGGRTPDAASAQGLRAAAAADQPGAAAPAQLHLLPPLRAGRRLSPVLRARAARKRLAPLRARCQPQPAHHHAADADAAVARHRAIVIGSPGNKRKGAHMDIGFIGLGNMGFPMARRLVEAGHRVTVFDTRREPIERLVALGAEAANSVREVADRVETVVASLPTPDIVHAVAVGKGGLIEGNRVRRFVDLSTTGSVMAARIFETLGEREIVQIDSPVSGGVGGAEKGTLAVMGSGPRAGAGAGGPAAQGSGRGVFLRAPPGRGPNIELFHNF